MLDIYETRGLEVKDWLQKSISKLKGPSINIEDFVRKKASLDITYRDFPAQKYQLTILETLFHLMNEKEVPEILTK